MKRGDVVLVDRWRQAGPRMNLRSRFALAEFRAPKDRRIVFLCIGVLHDSESEDEMDATKMLIDLGWTPPEGGSDD